MRLIKLVILLLGCSFAAAEVAIIVHKSNQNKTLTAEDIKLIYLCKQKTFPNGEPAIPIDLAAGESRELFYDKVVQKNGAQLRSYFSRLIFTGKGRPPRQEETEQNIVELVANNPNFLGYVDTKYVNDSVTVVYSFS